MAMVMCLGGRDRKKFETTLSVVCGHRRSRRRRRRHRHRRVRMRMQARAVVLASVERLAVWVGDWVWVPTSTSASASASALAPAGVGASCRVGVGVGGHFCRQHSAQAAPAVELAALAPDSGGAPRPAYALQRLHGVRTCREMHCQ